MECLEHKEHEARLKAAEADIKDLFDRVRPLEDSRSRTEEIVKSLKDSFDKFSLDMAAKFNDLSNKIEKLKGKPGERWDKLINALIAAGAGVVASYFFNKK